MGGVNLNILVTGAAGFIGSHLTEELVKRGHRVKAFIRYNSSGSWGWLETSPLKNEIEVYQGDIRDYDGVKESLKNIDIVFHLAALIGIPYSYKSPLAYIKTNIEGTYNILKGSMEQGVKKIIHTSTSEVYGTAIYVPIDEQHPLQAQSPYSASKIGADQLALSFYRSFDLPVAVARPFNTYGPRQSARAIIPTVITQILSGKECIELGNLYPTRDLNYVKDTVEGLMAIAFSDRTIGEVINIGSGKEISIRELVLLISRIMNKKIEIKQDKQRLRPEKSEVERLCCDNTKIKNLTNWQSHYSLEEGLKETINWFSENYKFYKPEIYNT
ncbi:NAD-dependent 4,6-dehydratase LegB [Thermoanaerobacterium sp. DL9XJH110]|uniref:NAD-dependent 4,6-dehydratase LegB n=1 Tax=Thermoanaerobacterium sp. DL9XJH110 TaxID=3386643 RepID=UPI003BB6F149